MRRYTIRLGSIARSLDLKAVQTAEVKSSALFMRSSQGREAGPERLIGFAKTANVYYTFLCLSHRKDSNFF